MTRPTELYSAQDRSLLDHIKQDHKKILEKISLIQIRTSKILLDQEKDIINFYNEKINELTQQFREETTRQKERHASFKKKEEKLMSELEWIKKIAHKIDIENYYLVKRYTELKVEFETQKNDRVALMTESAFQKKRTEDLEGKISEYKGLLQKLMKDKDLDPEFELDKLAAEKGFKYVSDLKNGSEKHNDIRSIL